MKSPTPPSRSLARSGTGRVVTLLLALLLASAAGWEARAEKPKKPDTAAKIRALRERLRTLNQKKATARVGLRETKRSQRRIADELNASYQRLEQANAALKTSAFRLHQAEVLVRQATARLKAAEARLKEQQRRFGRRLAVAYMQGPVSATDVLIGARGLSDYLDRQYYVEQVMGEDADLLSELRAAQREVARERRTVLARRSELSVAHEENFTRVAEASRQAADYETRRKALLKERSAQEQEFQELEEDSHEVQRSLEREMARRQANPGGFQALPRWSGQLFRPTAGRFGSGFGPRFHPILHYWRMHTGVDIGGKMGQPVYAAASGEVFHASWRGGYGKCIILLHGGEMSTLYGHLSSFTVRVGQRVQRGQVIGQVGSTGLSTAPHLHFEVRRNGRPVNPL